jgi:hypothetical protein
MNYRKIKDMCQERMPLNLRDFAICILMGLKIIKPVLEVQIMFEAKAQSGSKAERTTRGWKPLPHL